MKSNAQIKKKRLIRQTTMYNEHFTIHISQHKQSSLMAMAMWFLYCVLCAFRNCLFSGFSIRIKQTTFRKSNKIFLLKCEQPKTFVRCDKNTIFRIQNRFISVYEQWTCTKTNAKGEKKETFYLIIYSFLIATKA